MKFKLGAKKDKIDNRDYKIKRILPTAMEIPSKLDYSSFMGKVRDQKDVGACVGFATAGVKECQENIQIKEHINFSPIYIYWQRQNSPDSGMEPREALDILKTQGIIYEELLPYENNNVREVGNISDDFKTLGLNFKIDSYLRVETIEEIEKTLAQFGPIVCTMAVYPYMFYLGKNNCTLKPIRDVNRTDFIGGHAIIMVGYNSEERMFKFKNSWGQSWGQDGYFYCSYDNWNDYVWDMWQIVDGKSDKVGMGYKILKLQKGIAKFARKWLPFGRLFLGN